MSGAGTADAGKTTAEGSVPVLIKRLFPVVAGQADPEKTPVDVTVIVRLGVVSSTTVVRF